jgi:hypothetical protein
VRRRRRQSMSSSRTKPMASKEVGESREEAAARRRHPACATLLGTEKRPVSLLSKLFERASLFRNSRLGPSQPRVVRTAGCNRDRLRTAHRGWMPLALMMTPHFSISLFR